ncbi:phospholipase [Halalkalibacillus sediminis]|uniref:Phospholipase n=1 Tax=Halalkalibacillus sediminis TaxID=2018042 RepID=A0A2I0QUZ4_9BACI|nr:alpha/beta hydrolase [Halalkalibacillus sediminis]PKR78146.1 phospholipase [Halalkalibacillus sediminis]
MIVRETENPTAVVVVIHGAFEHSGRYEWLFNKLLKQGYHIVYGDLPGQGVTQKKLGHIKSFKQYFDTVSEWIDQAKTYDLPVFLLGHSMGGLIAIRILQEQNIEVDGVILSSPALGLCNVPEKPLYMLSKVLNVLAPSVLVPTNVHSKMATRNEAFIARDVSDPLYLRKVSVRWYLEFEKGIDLAFKKIKKYPDVPTLLLQSGEDLLVDVDAVKKWFNQVDLSEKKIKIYEDLYHEILNEPERDEVYADVIQFIEHQRN